MRHIDHPKSTKRPSLICTDYRTLAWLSYPSVPIAPYSPTCLEIYVYLIDCRNAHENSGNLVDLKKGTWITFILYVLKRSYIHNIYKTFLTEIWSLKVCLQTASTWVFKHLICRAHIGHHVGYLLCIILIQVHIQKYNVYQDRYRKWKKENNIKRCHCSFYLLWNVKNNCL